ncbi:efflux transporter outer membrane subunit [Comamonas thiooxydans]|uniref:RND transporter n=1 Tax=Comamonas thiooxydans TaxID=363952 RepID=A0A0E3CES0_9BURK|nr:efflux transporter outer membrane subunit [Comamonas thiooxydans]KGH08686.1 RND transporter [Comamonas thiooxydans]KGH15317.1 RND transporter [Comamonas thiooxydans]KGH20442.1 RND transporter [Comamonas thiooxydans]
MKNAFHTVRALPLALALLMAGCSVPSLTRAPDSAQSAVPVSWSTDQAAGAADAVQAGWWQAFGDAQLSRWVELALARNNDVLTAVSRVEEARANLEVTGSAAAPQLSLSAPGSANRSLSARTGQMVHVRSAQPVLQASWELDLWDRLGSLSRAADRRLQASQADRDAVRLTVAATVAQAYIALRSLQAQLAVAENTVKSREDAVRLLTDQVRVGYISQLQQSQALAELESVRQSVQQLSLALQRQRIALMQLVGGSGDDQAQALARTTLSAHAGLESMSLPAMPAPGLPSSLLERRPDIARAQLLLAASDSNLAAQRAAFLPQVSLSANFGSLFINALDYNPARVWSLGGSILAPLFNGGRLQGQFDAASAQRDQAAYAYRGVVIKAFGDVETALVSSQQLQAQWEHAKEREKVLGRTLGFAKDRYEAGYASYLEELDAQRNLFAVQQEVLRLRQSQLENAVALYQALGGGWQLADTAAPQP